MIVNVVWVVPRNASTSHSFREVGIPNLHVSHYYWEEGTTSNISHHTEMLQFLILLTLDLYQPCIFVYIYIKLHVFTVDLCHMISLLPLLRWQKNTSMHPNQPTNCGFRPGVLRHKQSWSWPGSGETIDAMLLQATHWATQATHNTPNGPQKRK